MKRLDERLTIVLISALAAIVRLSTLDQPMRYDEGVSWAYYVGRPWATIVGVYKQPNNHVLYSLVAKLVAAPFGYPPWALRLPALIAGIAIVPLTWLIGRRIADARTALLAAGLASGSTALALFSTNARGYSLVVAGFLTLLLLADSLFRAPATRTWSVLIAVGAAGLYVVPIMLYPIAVVSVWIALRAYALDASQRLGMMVSAAVSVCAMLAIAGCLYSPIIAHDGLSVITGNKFVAPSTWQMFAAELPRMFASTLANWSSPLPVWFIPIVGLLALVGMLDVQLRSLVCASVIGSLVLLLATHKVPFVRVWLFLLPLFLIAISRGVWRALDVLFRRRVASEYVPLSAALMISILAYRTQAVATSDETGRFRPALAVTNSLRRALRSSDRVLAPPPAIGPLLYYFPMAGLDSTLLTKPLNIANRAFIVLSSADGQTLEWAVEHHIFDHEHFTNPALVAHFPEGDVYVTGPR